MFDESTVGDEARTDRDAPTTEKPDAVVLGRGETRTPDDDAVLLTDGGVDIADDLQHDPRGFDFTISPAVVVEVGKDDVVSKVSFADVQLRECGALRWTEWTGAEGLIPEWRWSEVRYLETERVGEDGLKTMTRIAPCDWNLLSDAVQEMADQDDDADGPNLVPNCGHVPDHNPGTTAPEWNEVKSSSFADDGVARFPELVGIDRDIILTLSRAAPCNGQELLADLETLRNEQIGDARLYPHLNELVDAGLAEKRENYRDDRAHEFRLADDGRRALREHLQRVQSAVEAFEEER